MFEDLLETPGAQSAFLSPTTTTTLTNETDISTQIGRLLSPDVTTTTRDILSPTTTITQEQAGAFNLKGVFNVDASKKAMIIAPVTVSGSTGVGISSNPSASETTPPLIDLGGGAGNLIILGLLAGGALLLLSGALGGGKK